MNNLKNHCLQSLAQKLLDHCINVDYDDIVTNYDNWNEYLMENFGTTQHDVEHICNLKLTNLWETTESHEHFQNKLREAFNSYLIMNNKDQYTINELLYILSNHQSFNGEDFNISIQYEDETWGPCIPTLTAFVNVQTRGIHFHITDVEFEIETVGTEHWNCITIRHAQKH